MRLSYSLLFLLFLSCSLTAQQTKTKVLSLGSFHFDFPNQDFVKVEGSQQIDVLQARFQEEIEDIVQKLEAFKPTMIVIEQPPANQRKVDSLFQAYKDGKHLLGRAEWQQLGFRLAQKMDVNQLYCVDEWGAFIPEVAEVLFGKDNPGRKNFSEYYRKEIDADLKFKPRPVYKSEGILAELIELNKPENIRKSLGNYLVGPFKYEKENGDFFGVNFETGRWFNRNLKIFRNIQRIQAGPEDRLLIIYGSGHLNILNLLFKSSPEFELVNTNDFLISS